MDLAACILITRRGDGEREREREREREETLFRGTLQLPKLITAGASVPGIINPAGKDDPSPRPIRGDARGNYSS